MAVYMSPGVYPNEIDRSFLVSGVGAIRPAFIGTAKKGPLNTPMLISDAEQYIDVFGEPFSESYLGYAVLAYLEEGESCYVERVGVEYEEGMPNDLAGVSIDTSGAKTYGWGRIPVFTGIDCGKIIFRTPTIDNPIVFHDDFVDNLSYSDIEVGGTGGPTDAEVVVSGNYVDSIDDVFTILITSYPNQMTGDPLVGATYEVYRNSDGEMVSSGTLATGGPNESAPFQVGDGDDFSGLTAVVKVTSGRLGPQDSFSFEAHPHNRYFSFWVDREVEATSGDPVVVQYEIPNGTIVDSVDDFVTAFNDAYDVATGTMQVKNGDYIAVNINGDLYVRTKDKGKSIQLMGTEAFALEVGQSKYAWDVVRSYLVGNDVEPYSITASNNTIAIKVVSEDDSEIFEFSIPTGFNQSAQAIADAIHDHGVYMGKRYWRSYALQTSDYDYRVVIETTDNNEFDLLQMVATTSHVKTLRFVEELGIPYPYKKPYRGYTDNRLFLPDGSNSDPSIPESCETSPTSAQCASDADYYQNIVGWFIATSPGTWIDDHIISLEPYTEGLGSASGRFKLVIYDAETRFATDSVEDFTFNKNDERYIGNILNPESTIGGINGHSIVNWEGRPTYLDNDPNSEDYEVRVPAAFYYTAFDGGANGIPEDPIYSTELDRVVIGNPSESTGVFAFDNSETYDINLLATPGFSSGSVIGQCIQLCQSRGDVLYVVDPPYGLRPQQVIDWHNGMLMSDLSQAIDSSYGTLYWGWLKIFDQFSGEDVWIPPTGYAMSVFARTAEVAEQWFAPAGLRRGKLFTPLDIEYNPTQGERDSLYGSGNAVNPIVNFVHEGLTVWGQRTLQRQASALDRVNVRMLLIYIKKNLSRTLRNFVFEQNDETTWEEMKAVADGFLADIQARRGLDWFNTVCDASINTPERRDRNEMWINLYLKPTRVGEFIVMNLIVMRSDMSVSATAAVTRQAA